jgi:hypothetical protein
MEGMEYFSSVLGGSVIVSEEVGKLSQVDLRCWFARKRVESTPPALEFFLVGFRAILGY